MTKHQLESKIYDTKSYIADKFRDIQGQANTLKNVEDETKVLQALAKISDFTADIQRGYGTLNALLLEEPEDDEDEDDHSVYRRGKYA